MRTPTTLDWKEILQHDPLFRELKAGERRDLLEDPSTREIQPKQGDILCRQGEEGHSVFYIGSGQVSIEFEMEGGERLSVAILRQGEIFGEMAVLEGKPRLASAVAHTDACLLELHEMLFRKVLTDHPLLHFKVSALLNERLRQFTELVLGQLQELAQKFDHLRVEVDSHLQTAEKSLKAAETIFSSVNARATEIIQSSDRLWTDVRRFGMLASLLIVLITSMAGFFGYRTYTDVVNNAAKVTVSKSEVEAAAHKVGATAADVTRIKNDAESMKKDIDRAYRRAVFYKEFFEPKFFYYYVGEVFKREINERTGDYGFSTLVAALRLGERRITDRVFEIIAGGLSQEFVQEEHVRLLKLARQAIRDGQIKGTRNTLVIYFLSLYGAALEDGDNFEPILSEFEGHVARTREKNLRASFPSEASLEELESILERHLSQLGNSRTRRDFETKVDMLKTAWNSIP